MCPAHTLAPRDEMKTFQVKCEMKCKRLKMNQEAFFSPSLRKCFLSSNIPGRVFFFFYPVLGFLVSLSEKPETPQKGFMVWNVWVTEVEFIYCYLFVFICTPIPEVCKLVNITDKFLGLPDDSMIARGEEAGLRLSQIDSCCIQSDYTKQHE